MVFERYSTTQKLCFLAVGIGFLMCGGPGLTPALKTGKIDIKTVASVLDLDLGNVLDNLPVVKDFADVKLIEFSGGLFMYCIDSDIDEASVCEGYDFDESSGHEKTSAFLWVIGCILALISLFTICCRMCCFEGGRTIGQGILSFSAGACFLISVITFHEDSEKSWEWKLLHVEYTWLYYIYLIGGIVITVSAFILCCAYPESTLRGMVFSTIHRQPSVVVASSMTTHSSAAPYSVLAEEPYVAAPLPRVTQSQSIVSVA